MTDATSQSPVQIRPTAIEDGAAVAQLVRATGVLEPNTTYAYLLLAHHFGDTCLVAEVDGKLAGCVLSYRLPREPNVLFVWQIGVDPAFQGRGIGKKLLRAYPEQSALSDVRFVEMTIARSNAASQGLFRAWAKEMGTEVTVAGEFSGDLFGPEAHEAEEVLRIGPVNWTKKS